MSENGHSKNPRRAECAAKALDTYPHNENPEPEVRLTDLLANLMHYCDWVRIDFDKCLEEARDHFEHERAEEQP